MLFVHHMNNNTHWWDICITNPFKTHSDKQSTEQRPINLNKTIKQLPPSSAGAFWDLGIPEKVTESGFAMKSRLCALPRSQVHARMSRTKEKTSFPIFANLMSDVIYREVKHEARFSVLLPSNFLVALAALKCYKTYYTKVLFMYLILPVSGPIKAGQYIPRVLIFSLLTS